MKLRQIMSPNPVCVTPQTPLVEAARQMEKIDCGFLPVTHEGRIEGVITDRDIVVRGLAHGRNPDRTTVRECMSPSPLHCFEDDDVSVAVRAMENRQIRRLPVLNRSNQLVGIVSLGDLAIQTHDQRLSGEVLERVSVPTHPRAKAGTKAA
jgi:CBS domain-containing protein